MYLPDRKYFFPAADPGVGDRLPEPVRKRESDSGCGTGDFGNGGQYRGGNFVLQIVGDVYSEQIIFTSHGFKNSCCPVQTEVPDNNSVPEGCV